MKNHFVKLCFLLLFAFTVSACHKMAHAFYNPDMCKPGKKRKGNFKQKDIDRRAKSGQETQ